MSSSWEHPEGNMSSAESHIEPLATQVGYIEDLAATLFDGRQADVGARARRVYATLHSYDLHVSGQVTVHNGSSQIGLDEAENFLFDPIPSIRIEREEDRSVCNLVLNSLYGTVQVFAPNRSAVPSRATFRLRSNPYFVSTNDATTGESSWGTLDILSSPLPIQRDTDYMLNETQVQDLTSLIRSLRVSGNDEAVGAEIIDQGIYALLLHATQGRPVQSDDSIRHAMDRLYLEQEALAKSHGEMALKQRLHKKMTNGWAIYMGRTVYIGEAGPKEQEIDIQYSLGALPGSLAESSSCHLVMRGAKRLFRQRDTYSEETVKTLRMQAELYKDEQAMRLLQGMILWKFGLSHRYEVGGRQRHGAFEGFRDATYDDLNEVTAALDFARNYSKSEWK